MKIAMISPPWFSLPIRGYGGIEVVVYDVTEALIKLGHEVILFAPGDSHSSARLVATVPTGVTLEHSQQVRDDYLRTTSQLAFAQAIAAGVDVIHDHTDYETPSPIPVPAVNTVHFPAIDPNVRRYQRMSRLGNAFIMISARQEELFRQRAEELFGSRDAINIIGYVHNPLDTTNIPFSSEKDDYALFLGRCDWEKNPDGAIRVAKAAGIKLKMALRILSNERPYCESRVMPLIDENVELLGEITPEEKYELMRRAKVVLFTSQWEEPFGLVMTEAAACGTPVIALRRGAAPEVIIDGFTGFVCDDENDMIKAVGRVGEIDPHACRRHIEMNFSPLKAASEYLALYQRVIDRQMEAAR
ncbi:MAG: glycosyltransferase family 4 protein [Chloroflexi bacterium]|nr:glycosyltransferase family 4 protein [Chloroflexota bacterium]